jgi:hypothetical protein
MDGQQLRVDLVHRRGAQDESPVHQTDGVEELERVLSLLGAVVLLVEEQARLVDEGHGTHGLVGRAVELFR